MNALEKIGEEKNALKMLVEKLREQEVNVEICKRTRKIDILLKEKIN